MCIEACDGSAFCIGREARSHQAIALMGLIGTIYGSPWQFDEDSGLALTPLPNVLAIQAYGVRATAPHGSRICCRAAATMQNYASIAMAQVNLAQPDHAGNAMVLAGWPDNAIKGFVMHSLHVSFATGNTPATFLAC